MSTRTSPPDPEYSGRGGGRPGGDSGRGGDKQSLVAAARRWLDDDPDTETRAELSAVLDAGDHDALADRFGSELTFGTAGLRGELGAGPNRMNRVVVQRAAAGLAAYLRSTGSTHGERVVIGYDARHNSEVFAADTADVLQGAGFTALVLPRPLPTPVLAYAIRTLGCVAGVMVTASHNPPRDNGYKVYLGDGSQIVPPADTDISAEIAAVGRVRDLSKDHGWKRVDESLVERYVRRAASLVDPASPRGLRIAYTPMHGVGLQVFERAFAAAGFAPAAVVAEQAEPDPDFPTVRFPNPEEPGALDLATATAVAAGADLVIANDPDADRCAVAVPDGAGGDSGGGGVGPGGDSGGGGVGPGGDSGGGGVGGGGFSMLRGDEVGALIAAHLLRREPRPDGVFAASIVSGTLVHRMADAAGVSYVDTLTGFKWLSRVPHLRYAYEEALGYCVDPAAVADKDGITAALLVCELAASLRAEGRTLTDLLDELAVRHGQHTTDQLSVRLARIEDSDAVLTRLLAAPPASIGGLAVESVEDLAGDTGLPPTPGVRLRLAERTRVVVRPSGTEPKLKCYLEVVVPVTGGDVASARAAASERIAALRSELGSLVRT